MRALPLLAVVALLVSCAGPLPRPDPQRAWIELHSLPGELLMAESIDHRPTRDGRYFQVDPGSHRLEVSYRFEEYLGSSFARDPVRMLCYLRLDYDGFAAGQRYRLRARHQLLQSESWLEDANGQRLASGREWQCLPQ